MSSNSWVSSGVPVGDQLVLAGTVMFLLEGRGATRMEGREWAGHAQVEVLRCAYLQHASAIRSLSCMFAPKAESMFADMVVRLMCRAAFVSSCFRNVADYNVILLEVAGYPPGLDHMPCPVTQDQHNKPVWYDEFGMTMCQSKLSPDALMYSFWCSLSTDDLIQENMLAVKKRGHLVGWYDDRQACRKFKTKASSKDIRSRGRRTVI